MSVRYDADTQHLGMPVTRYRDALRSWDRTRDLPKLAKGSLFDNDIAGAAVVVDDAEAREFFAQDQRDGMYSGYLPTEAGKALLGATPMKPIPAKKAWSLVQGVLGNVEAAAKLKGLPFRVDRIWLYGSLAQGSPEVNDVDLVVEMEVERLGRDSVRGPKVIEMAIEMGGEAYIGRFRGNRALPAAGYVARRMIYGPRMHPRISVGDLDELIAMHRPCRLLYDRSLGGRVAEETRPHHPASKGRDESRIDQPRRMPDLGPSPAHPVSIHHAIEVASEFMNVPGISAGIRQFAQMTRAPVGISEASWRRAMSPELEDWLKEAGPLDGKAAGAIVYEKSPEGFVDWRVPIRPLVCVKLDRAMSYEDGGSLRYQLGMPTFFDGSARSEAAMKAIAHAVAGCLLADRAAMKMRKDLPSEGIYFKLAMPGGRNQRGAMENMVLRYAEFQQIAADDRIEWAGKMRDQRRKDRERWKREDLGEEGINPPQM